MKDAGDRLRDLEHRLAEYHSHLEEALERDRQLQLNATWGIVKGANGVFALFILPGLLNRWLHFSGVASIICGAAVAIIGLIAIGGWTERGHADDKDKLAQLPRWQSTNTDWFGDD